MTFRVLETSRLVLVHILITIRILRHKRIVTIEEQPATIRQIPRLIQRLNYSVWSPPRNISRHQMTFPHTRSPPAIEMSARRSYPTPYRPRSRRIARRTHQPTRFRRQIFRHMIEIYLLVRHTTNCIMIIITSQRPIRHKRQPLTIGRHTRSHFTQTPTASPVRRIVSRERGYEPRHPIMRDIQVTSRACGGASRAVLALSRRGALRQHTVSDEIHITAIFIG